MGENILNCSPVGGNIITDTSAVISFFGQEDTIANISIKARTDSVGKMAKEDNFDHLVIGDISFPRSYAKVFYEALWMQFFANNREIVDKIRQYDGYFDGYPENTANSAARVFDLVKKYGINGLASNVKSFTKELKEKKEQTGNKEKSELQEQFSQMDTMARRLVKEYCGVISLDEILSKAESEEVADLKIFRRLIRARYDEYDGNSSSDYTKRELDGIRQDFLK